MIAVVKIVLVVSVFTLLYGCLSGGIFKPSASQSKAVSATTAGAAVNVGAEIHCSKTGNGQKFFIITDSNDGKLSRVKVGATGYGAPPKKYYPEAQRRLMTMRASKVDAYRAMAEVVGGLHIWGGSAIGDMVLEHDRYRSFVDTYVRGARIVSVQPTADGAYITVVEMEVNQRFLSQVMVFLNSENNIDCADNINNAMFTLDDPNNISPSFYYSE
ncbi:MAG: hypothetical protein GXP08_09080 [Gammaproteobacteria bacterium]|nr:hypothetical protein [Gammaproteobacteria bacterium]